MKKINILFAAIVSLVVSSCSLKEEPYGFPSTGNFYKSEADANSALVYAYSILPEIEYYSREFILVTEVPTENLTLKPDAGANNFELDELRTRPDNTDLTSIWRYGYIGINRANAVITKVPDIAMDETKRNEIVGEGYFLRALHYFNLVRLFGEIPIHTDMVSTPDQVSVPKSSMKDVYDVIIGDLTKSIDMTDTELREGRGNKVAAQTLLAKVYLYLASAKSSGSPGYDFVADADANYANAATYSAKVLNEQTTYGFEPNLLDIWDITKENGIEHIFSASTDRTGQLEGNYSKLPLMFIPYIDGAVFKLEDGTSVASGWNHLLTEPAIYNNYDDADKRKSDLIASKVWVNGTERDLGITDYSRPFTRKFIDPGRVGDQTSVNTPILRFTDALLIFAEATGPTTDGYAAVNKVRARAGLGDLTPGLNVDDFRSAVVEERSFEFAFEGDRIFDLRRTNTVEEILVTKYGKTIQSGAYFFAIPQQEVDNNPFID
ncbi:MAG TPA: RagB/SusD family nutrient uptake outer membrane protein [Cyclobacteriaceae bacterium]|nr:RagB/SusD family nutrient uptake outer membrane protein [Cyclobacteriaceae bacterium]